MTEGWTNEEKCKQRRLVQFTTERCDKSNKIKCSFHAIPQVETTQMEHNVVSRIHWEEHQEYVVTSVDCIYLVECILKVQFSVDEKYRIRRNLEGFRLLNVSKYKETATFFNSIMEYTHPKPRNIIKDIKVFSWKILPYALKKIVAKYVSASQSNNGSLFTSK